MILIGQRITKINGERYDLESKSGLKNISSNAIPKTLKEGKSADSKKKVLIVGWEFISEYDLTDDQKLAKLLIAGEVIYELDTKDFKNIFDEWKKNKSINKEQLLPIMQNILNIAQVEGIIIAKEMNLPSPVQLLRIKESE
ncbi:MAG: hypothetical protein GON13_02450 [Nanoarchaeota archaeon]|nr:hypothetical protein [Nanoarchaeota archaeon]